MVQPLNEIALCGIQIDMADRSGTHDRHRRSATMPAAHASRHSISGISATQCVAGTHDFAPVFVGRAWACASQPITSSVLADRNAGHASV